MAVLSTDTFNRADGAMGSTDGAGTKDPVAWVRPVAAWSILSNQARPSTSALRSHAYVDLAVADVDVSVAIPVVQTSQLIGLCFRETDENNVLLAVTNGASPLKLSLQKRVTSTQTTLGTGTTTVVNGDTVRVVANGSTINVYLNGVLEVGPVTESFNSTATKHGMWASSAANARFDSWSASDAAVTTTVTGTQATETDTGNSGSLTSATTVTGTQATETDTANAGTITSAASVTGTQATETDTANAGAVTSVALTTVAGEQAVETSTAFDGAILIDPIGNRFTPPTENTVSNIAFDAHPTANKLGRYYPLRKRGHAVFKLPDGTYTFTQPYPWVTRDDVGTPTRAFPDPPVGRGDSNLKVQTVELVYYGGHEYVIDDDEAAGLSAFLTAEGYTPGDWITT